MEKLNQGIESVKGFHNLGVCAGIKPSGKKDLGVIYSDRVCSAAGVFTTNSVVGAPVVLNKRYLRNGQAQAIIVNSGIANTCNGPEGIKDAESMADLLASQLRIPKENVLVGSTGVIGKRLPMEKIKKKINEMNLSSFTDKEDFAESILTTDLVKKQCTVKTENFTVSGVAKGSGMIHPDMATMLSFIVTDAKITPDGLQKYLKASVDKSFNMISVDRDTSTSDMVLVLANGTAEKTDLSEFQEALDIVCIELAKQVAMDGEGATKLIEVDVINAASVKQARKVAKSVITSNLVKCAVFGNDPNWGRIMCAVGYSGEKVDQDKITLMINGYKIFENSMESPEYNEKKISEGMKNSKNIHIMIDLNESGSKATAYGCDLSYDYVKINAEYTT